MRHLIAKLDRVGDLNREGFGEKLAEAIAAEAPDRGQLGIGCRKIIHQRRTGKDDVAFRIGTPGNPFDAVVFGVGLGNVFKGPVQSLRTEHRLDQVQFVGDFEKLSMKLMTAMDQLENAFLTGGWAMFF